MSDNIQLSRITPQGAPAGFTGLFLSPDETDNSAVRTLAEIARLGLEHNAWELDTLGYTILSPEQTRADDLALRMREKLLDAAEAETGTRPDIEGGERLVAGMTPIGRGQMIANPLFLDVAFEQALMNESALALITYLLGESCVVSGMTGMLKCRQPENLELHSDQVGQPSPLPPYAQVANATWVLTDYSPENGATRFVPGSHKFCRHPTKAEALDFSTAVTVSAPAGSIVIWHGNTWHGAAPRTRHGARMSFIMLFCRWYLLSQELYRQRVTVEMMERNLDRFTTLMGRRSPYAGFDSDGARVDFTLGQASQFA